MIISECKTFNIGKTDQTCARYEPLYIVKYSSQLFIVISLLLCDEKNLK